MDKLKKLKTSKPEEFETLTKNLESAVKNTEPSTENLENVTQSVLKSFKRLMETDSNNNLNLVDVNSIIIQENNPRKHPKKQLQKLKNSIKKFGYTTPIIVDDKYHLISGELRLMAIKELKVEKIPVIVLENVTEEQARAIRIADNRIAEDGTWDFSLLKEELDKILQFDITFEDIGFETTDYDKIFISENSEENKVDNNEDSSWLDDNIPKRVNKGDLVRLGDHFLFCGDSLDEKSFEAVMQGEKAQIVIADPPYNCPIDKYVCGLGKTKHEEFEMASGEMSEVEFGQFISGFVSNLIKYSDDSSLHYLFMDWKGINTLQNQCNRLYNEMLNLAVWNKGVGGMGAFYRSQHELVAIYKNGKGKHQNHIQLGKYGRYRTNVWDYPGIRATNPSSLELLKLHPTVKPVAMLHDILLDASSKNEIVLDCFGGSGSTLLAAERAKRRTRLIEISPRYCDVTIWRWEKETGKQAKVVKNIEEINHGE